MPPKRKAIDRETVINEALGLIEEQGLAGFSLRKLAARVGCEAMSLYNHFRNKQAILNALVDHLIDSMSAPDPAQDPIEQLKHIAREWRRLARQYPSFFQYLGLHRLNSPAGVRFLNRILEILELTGMDPETAARLFRVVNYFLVGAALDESAGYAQGPGSSEPVSDDEIATHFQALARAGQFFSPDQFDQTFEWGLSLLLDPFISAEQS